MMELLFLARHIPFWSIPLFLIGLEFGYVFWLRKKKKTAMVGVLISLIGLSATIFYIWVGGPEKSVKYVRNIYLSDELK